jgi:holliday junction DNA helicase RuvA
MIATLRGTLQQRGLDRVVVDVNGVGYLVHVSSQTLATLPAVGEQVQLLCHTHVREDALQIFGFAGAAEQQAFELLIAVSGIGPKLALTTLSGMPVRELVEAIAAEDHRRLQTIPGIGKKTAERMVVELKERCAALAGELAPVDPGKSLTAPLPTEVVEALVNLGYRRQAAQRAVERALEQAGQPPPPPEQLLRAALVAMREQ